MPKVLIIDDSELFGSRLKEVLSDIQSVQVLGQARSVKEGLAFCKIFDPDIIFLDIKLPDGSGAKVLPILKEIRPKVSVIVLSNFDTDFQKMLIPGLGGDFYLDKSKEYLRIPEILSKIISSEKIVESRFPLNGKGKLPRKKTLNTSDRALKYIIEEASA